MRYHNVYDDLSQGGKVRLSFWHEDSWVRCKDNTEEELYLLDQNGTEYELTECELKSERWEVVRDLLPKIDDFDLDKLLHYTKMTMVSKVLHYKRQSQAFLLSYADEHNAVSSWNYEDNLKYNIVYNHISDEFKLDYVWATSGVNSVYFSDLEVAKQAIKQYEPLLRIVVELEQLMGLLYNNEYTKEQLLKMIKELNRY